MVDFRKHGNKHDDPLAGLTARALGGSAAPESACPDASLLAAYFERSLPEVEAAQHEQHFAACTRCQQQLAILARLETAQPANAADPSLAAEPRGWRRYWNWKMWVPATAALATLALWIVGTTRMERVAAPLSARVEAPAEIAQNRQQPAVPSETSRLSADAIARKDAAAKPPGADSVEAKKDAPPRGAKREESIALAGRVSVPAPVAAPAPAAAAPAEEKVVAKLESVEADKLRDAQKTRQAAAEPAAPPQVATAQSERERAQGLAQQSAAQNEALKRKLPAREGDLGAFRAANRAPAMLASPAYATIHAPAPSLAIWRIGPGSTLEKSPDSGRTWQSQKLPAGVSVLAGSASSEKVCWLVGRAGAVLRTVDGGAKWEKLPAPVETDLTGVEARDADNATVATADGRRFTTSEGGRTWKLLN